MSPKLSSRRSNRNRRRTPWTLAPSLIVPFLLSAASAESLSSISDLVVRENGDSTVVQLRASAKPMFSVFKLERPLRLTVDIANGRFREVPGLTEAETWAVSQVATAQIRTSAATIARVMINFRRAAHYAVRTEGQMLVITVTPSESRPKTDPVRITRELERAREAAEVARRAEDTARKQATGAQEATARALREAELAQAGLARARELSERLKREADEARRLAEQSRDAAQSARSAAERERHQAASARLLAEQRRKQSAAAYASLEQQKKELEALRLAKENGRREALSARAQAAAARAEAETMRAEAAASRAEAQRQREVAVTHSHTLNRALQDMERHTGELRAAQAESHRHKGAWDAARKSAAAYAREVQRLQSEVEKARLLAQREAAGKRAHTAAAQQRVLDLELKLSRSVALAGRAQAAQEQSRQVLAGAEQRVNAVERARREAETARALAQKGQQGAEAARSAAEKARMVAEAARSAAEERLREAATRKAKLERALEEAQRREARQRAELSKAVTQAEESRRAAQAARRAHESLARQVEEARSREATLLQDMNRVRAELDRQQATAQAGRQEMARLRQGAREARDRLARQTDGRAKEDARSDVERAEVRLAQAEQARRAAETARAELLAGIRRTAKERGVVANELRRAQAQLAEAQGRADTTEQKLAQAEQKLAENRRFLDSAVAQRATEEARRQVAEKARRAEEVRLLDAKAQRQDAEKERDVVERRLVEVKQSLAKVKEARVAEERALAQVREAQSEPTRASAPSQQLVGKDKGPLLPKAAFAIVKDIRYVDRQDAARIEIVLEGKARYRLAREGDVPVLALDGVTLPKLLQRTLDASEYLGPVQQITSLAPEARKGAAVVRVTLRDPSSASTLRQEGQKLVWAFAKPRPTGQTPLAAGPGAPVASKPAEAYPYQSDQVAGARVRRGRDARRYSGRRIDLDFKDADIHNILRLLSDVGNVNIVTADNVSGRVTIRMRNVPWDQALDVILRAKGLGQVMEGNLLRVAPAADLEKEREAEIARMKQVMLLQPLETRLIPLSYAQAGNMLSKINYALSPRGKLTFDDRTNMVIARDIAGNLDVMERLIRNLDSQTPVVLIEARIVEATTNFSREVGIQWGGSFVASQATGNSTGLVFPNTLGIGGGANGDSPNVSGLIPTPANPGFAVNMPAPAGQGSGGAVGLTLGSVSGAVNVNLRLSAAESTGDIRIVSAPRITTLDNVQARIEQGRTIPFSQVSAAGVQTTFMDAKLSLNVKPHVTSDGSVIMTVQVTRNEPDFANTGPRGDPTILRKEAQTQMLVKDGDTAVIGGIYTTRTGRSWQKVPWFAEIPILGWLFKHKRDTSDRDEVLVFITPRIINRAQSIGSR